MATAERGELQVVIPVGFLLTEAREVTVSVDRPGAAPLPIRLRLVPARTTGPTGAAVAAGPVEGSAPTPLRIAWPERRGFADDGCDEPEYGGGD
jgi:hypothetical protein